MQRGRCPQLNVDLFAGYPRLERFAPKAALQGGLNIRRFLIKHVRDPGWCARTAASRRLYRLPASPVCLAQ